MRPIVAAVLMVTTVWGQELPNYTEVRDLILKNLSTIEDYEVDMSMSIDIPGFRMPRRAVHYMFKAPDKMKVDVQGFAVVPREGIQPFTRFLNDSLQFEVLGESVYKDRPVFEIGFQDTFQSQEASIKLLVDAENGTIPRGNVIIDGTEMFSTRTRYELVSKSTWLPVHSTVRMNFPPDFKRMQSFGMSPQDARRLDEEVESNPEWVEGKIVLEFKNYKLNKGIPDWIFEEEEEYY